MSEYKESGFVSCTVKGVLVSVSFVLASVLLFATFMKLFNFSSGVIKPVNQVIKVLSVFCGAILCVCGNKGIIKGVIIGIFSVALTYLLFALMGGEGLFDVGFFLDVVFGAVIGAVSGVIAVNVKRN